MKTDKFGIPIYSREDVVEIIYKGLSENLSSINTDLSTDEVNQFNQYSDVKLKQYEEFNVDIEEFDSILQKDWLMPEEYKNMDIEGYLVHVCPKENYQRLIDELQEYRSRNMIDLLRWLKYFVDTCRKNNVVWGVGRGSSVASYVLFLLGVHRIDSLKYNLDWREFLR